MIHEITKKVPNGNSFRLKIDAEEKIDSIKITGDFFLSPEEAIETIETALTEAPKEATHKTLSEIIHNACAQNHAVFIGVTPENIADAILEALNSTPV